MARSAEELDAHVRSALGAIAMARGLAWRACARTTRCRRPPHALQKCESPVAADLVPVYDFREGEGRIPFPTNPSPHQLSFAREFLLVTNDRSEVVRVPANPLIEKLFATRHADAELWERKRDPQPAAAPTAPPE